MTIEIRHPVHHFIGRLSNLVLNFVVNSIKDLEQVLQIVRQAFTGIPHDGLTAHCGTANVFFGDECPDQFYGAARFFRSSHFELIVGIRFQYSHSGGEFECPNVQDLFSCCLVLRWFHSSPCFSRFPPPHTHRLTVEQPPPFV